MALILALLIFASVVRDPQPVAAGGGQPPVALGLRPAVTAIQPGSTFTVDVVLEMQPESHALTFVKMWLAFDPAVLRVREFAAAPLLPLIFDRQLGPGFARLEAAIGFNYQATLRHSATLATITFDAIGPAGSATLISWEQYQALSMAKWDEPAENVVGSVTGALIRIGSPFTVRAPLAQQLLTPGNSAVGVLPAAQVFSWKDPGKGGAMATRFRLAIKDGSREVVVVEREAVAFHSRRDGDGKWIYSYALTADETARLLPGKRYSWTVQAKTSAVTGWKNTNLRAFTIAR
jgi:hypothetical protein